MNAMTFLDYAGVTLFAAAGALAASRKQLDIIGFMFFATVTGIGGGTARDLILGVPVFWVDESLYILLCAVTAVCIFFTAHLIESRYRWVLWFAIAIACGEVIVANAEAARILGLDDGIALTRARRLTCRASGLTAQIQHYVMEAAMTAGGENDRAEALLAIPRPSGAPPFLLEVAPLSDIAGEIDLGLRGALITLIDPANAPDLDVRRFARLYRLTRAETAVCEHMVAGLTGAAIAELRRTSPETVKSQMNSLLVKTGVKRRSDLIRLIVRTLPPVG